MIKSLFSLSETYKSQPLLWMDALYYMTKFHRLIVLSLTNPLQFYAAWCGHCQHYKPQFIQIARDVNKVKPIAFHAVPCPKFAEICKDQGVKGYPSIKFYKAGSGEGEVLKHSIDANGILEKMGVKDHKGEIDAVQNTEIGENNKITHGEVVMKTSRGVSVKDLFHDATLSFDFAMRNSIFMTNDALTNEQSKVLRNWLDIVNKSIPVSMKAVKEDVMTLEHHFDEITVSEDNLLKHISAKTKNSWSENCSKGVMGVGYTCGLWELFHVVTVGIVQWNIMAHDRISTLDAADILKDYIENYFTCDECRKNFVTMYESCQFQRCERLSTNVSNEEEINWKQLPLWLWETHNDVNVRLLHEERKAAGLLKATFAEEQQARWPSKNDCYKCWLDGGGWKEDEVYKYLSSHYWPRDMLNIDRGSEKKKQTAVEKDEGKKRIDHDISPTFSPKSITAASLIIVLGLFFYNRRRKRYISLRISKSV